MLLAEKIHDVASGGVMQTAKATIKASARVFNFFSDMVYANKYRAVVRELTANAIDAHVAAGKRDVPVEVFLPTIFLPEFKVVDQGIGMSHDFVMGDFMAYADGSTKNRSNEMIGGFGVGSKSFLAYTDQATFRIVFENVVSTYSMFKDEDGCPSIALLSRGSTDEPNGVAVSFPVNPSDIAAFHEAAHEVLPYFEPQPTVHGLEKPLEPPAYVARGETWAMRPSAGPLNIIMGGVKYPVNAANLTSKFAFDDPARDLLDYGLDVKLPIGSCSVALSREALSYDDATIEAIGVVLRNVVDEVSASFSTMFDECPTVWEAQVRLKAEIGDLRYAGARGKFLAAHAKYRGEPIEVTTRLPRPVPWEAWTIPKPEWSRRARGMVQGYNRVRFERPEYVTPGNVQAVILDDLPQKPGSRVKARIQAYCDRINRTDDVLVLRPWRDFNEWDALGLLAALGGPTTVLRTSQLEAPPAERRAYSRKERPVRFFKPTAAWREGQPLKEKFRERWKSATAREVFNAPETGYFVEMQQFQPPPGVSQKWASGVLPVDEVYFVNSGDAARLRKDDAWVAFDDAFDAALARRLAEAVELPQRLAVARISELQNLFNFFRTTGFTVPPSKGSTPLGKIEKLYRRYVEPLTSGQHQLAPYVTAKLPRGIDGAALRGAFYDRQPLAARLLELANNRLSETDAEILKKVL